MDDICTWCGCAGCDPTNAFHSLLRRHGLHSRGWSEIRDGWLVLVDDLVVDLLDLHWSSNLAQIKEKFGALCFYAEDTNAAMEARIRRAERVSRRTCEVCGAPGQLGSVPGRAWLRTRCAEHARQPPADPDRHALPGWYAGHAQGIRLLAPTVRLLLTELNLEPVSLSAVAAPSAVQSLLPETTKVLLLQSPELLTDALAANLLAAWLAMRHRAIPFIACASRRALGERLVAMAADVPLDKLTRHAVNKDQRSAIRATTGDLVSTAVVVDDLARELDQVIAHVRGVAAMNEVGLVVLAGLGRHVLIPSAAPTPHQNAEDAGEAVGNALARLVFLAEDLDCVLVVLTADSDVAGFAATDSSLSMGIAVLAVRDEAGVLEVGEVRLRLLASGRLVAG